MLDALEFAHHHVAAPEVVGRHPYFQHNHLEFDRLAGRTRWREDVNRILARNGLAFELTKAGRIERGGPPVLSDRLRAAVFATGNHELDRLLETARREFFDRADGADQSALEHLWDAFEQAKTLHDPDIKRGAGLLLDAAAGGNADLRARLEHDATELTPDRPPRASATTGPARAVLHTQEEREYLFGRLYNLLALVFPRRS